MGGVNSGCYLSKALLVNWGEDEYHRRAMAESRAQYELGGVANIKPEAVGEPGQRTFRILIESGAASACLWLEKEQLFQLGEHLERATESEGTEPSEEFRESQWSGGATSLDFKIGKMSLVHNPASNSFFLTAHDLNDPEDSEAKLSFWVAHRQARDLAQEALRVCAAGRPICPLCDRPIDPEGHNCPHSNGHAGHLEF